MDTRHALIIAGATAFVVLSLGVLAGAFGSIDEAINDRIEAARGTSDGESLVGTVLSWPGSWWAALLATAAATLLAVASGARRRWWVPLVFMALAEIAIRLLKWAFDVPRPDDTLSDNAFPSGHATRAVVAWGLVAWTVVEWRRSRAQRTHVTQRAAVLIAVSLVVATGAGRILLGVHWASDVVAGWALGSAILGAALLVLGPDSEDAEAAWT